MSRLRLFHLYFSRYGFYNAIIILYHKIFSKPISKLSITNKIVIFFPNDVTFYVANCCKFYLSQHGYEVVIINDIPPNGFENCLHIIIGAPATKRLPLFYIPFQVEQYMCHTRWHTDKYLWYFNNFKFPILDYNQININHFVENKIISNDLFYAPISYIPDYKSLIGFENADLNRDIDVLFYGALNARRDKFLKVICETNLNVKIISYQSNLTVNEIYNYLLRSKIVINIHNWDNNLLETIRLFECLSLGCLVVSEKSLDIHHYEHLLDVVDFVEFMDVKQMLRRVQYWACNENERLEKVANGIVKLQAQENVFEKNLLKAVASY